MSAAAAASDSQGLFGDLEHNLNVRDYSNAGVVSESESEPDSQVPTQQADQHLGDDEQAHVPVASSRRPRAAKSAAAAASKEKKKLSNWTHEEDMQLLAALQKHVKDSAGQLPGTLRTKKGSPVSAPWKAIANLCDKVKALDGDAAAKACSARWTTLRAASAVSFNLMNTSVCLSACLLLTLTYMLCSSGQSAGNHRRVHTHAV